MFGDKIIHLEYIFHNTAQVNKTITELHAIQPKALLGVILKH